MARTFPLRIPLRGKARGARPCAPVRRDDGPPDRRLYPAHPFHPRFRDPALILRGVPAVPGAALLPWGHPSRAIRGAALGGADTR